MTKNPLRVTLTALLAASVLLASGCSTDKDAPGVPPGAARTPAPATLAPSVAPSADPTKATEEITKPKVDEESEAAVMYGAASAQAAQAVVNQYAYAMTSPQIQTGKLQGDAMVEVVGNLVDRDLYEDLLTNKPEWRALFFFQQPEAANRTDRVKVLRLHTSPLRVDTAFNGLPGLASAVTATVQMTKGDTTVVYERTVDVTLLQQADTTEGEWRIGAFYATKYKDVTAQYPAAK